MGDTAGFEKEAVAFIMEVCFVEDISVAKSIVAVTKPINVWTRNITEDLLNAQPFETTPIFLENGSFMVVSAVDFLVEVSDAFGITRFKPTEYITGDLEYATRFRKQIEMGLLATIPTIVWDDPTHVYPDLTDPIGYRIFWGVTTEYVSTPEEIMALHTERISHGEVYQLFTGIELKVFKVAVPERYTIASIMDLTAMGVEILELFDQSSVDLIDLDGTPNRFTVYTMRNAINYQITHEFKITIA